ncbi:MAG: hypothetical protein H6696_15330 [Deferribacteres bacterium]|nr:hypothetical protein [candidate division KSB1 bacterium]MCB9503300.1 hypothetical protein [Deferribacteres bacterium]
MNLLLRKLIPADSAGRLIASVNRKHENRNTGGNGLKFEMPVASTTQALSGYSENKSLMHGAK